MFEVVVLYCHGIRDFKVCIVFLVGLLSYMYVGEVV